MNPALVFHHLGLLSSHPETTADRLKALGYRVEESIVDPLQDVSLRMAIAGDGSPSVEIITPLRFDSPLGRQLKTRDNSVYHLCYLAPGFDEAEMILGGDSGRVFLVSEPKEAVLFGGKRVAFYFVEGLGLVEVIENGR